MYFIACIAASIAEISSAYRIGIGGFVDKNVFPYGGTSDYVAFPGGWVLSCSLQYVSITEAYSGYFPAIELIL